MTLRQRIVDDVAAASAAHLYNVLPEIAKLSPPEQYRRLKAHFETALLAYANAVDGRRAAEPGRN